jgi:hypothetical protein
MGGGWLSPVDVMLRGRKHNYLSGYDWIGFRVIVEMRGEEPPPEF